MNVYPVDFRPKLKPVTDLIGPSRIKLMGAFFLVAGLLAAFLLLP